MNEIHQKDLEQEIIKYVSSQSSNYVPRRGPIFDRIIQVGISIVMEMKGHYSPSGFNTQLINNNLEGTVLKADSTLINFLTILVLIKQHFQSYAIKLQ
jgi:hypothetical protein